VPGGRLRGSSPTVTLQETAMSAPHEAPLFHRLTGAGVFRMLHSWRTPTPRPGS
jgi:hypothetical protein